MDGLLASKHPQYTSSIGKNEVGLRVTPKGIIEKNVALYPKIWEPWDKFNSYRNGIEPIDLQLCNIRRSDACIEALSQSSPAASSERR